jgi:serine/threonine-protein kinase HipA
MVVPSRRKGEPAKRRRTGARSALSIWMNGEFVGTWTAPRDKPPVLAYDDMWLRSPASRALSLSLPFRPGNAPWQGQVVESYFQNLLPDHKELLERIQRRFALPSTHAFDLLAEIGRDCVGAIQLLPDGEEPEGVYRIDAEPMAEDDIARHLAMVSAPPVPGLEDPDDFRLSLAGAQEKSAFLWHQGRWCRPRGATPTTHIFKLPLGLVGGMRADLTASVENEWLCARILAAYGLPVAPCDMQRFGDTRVLVVERFDRRLAPAGGYWLRLPQEDICQATGTPPGAKYESDGGPGMERVLEVLRGSTKAESDRRNFIKTQILFWMLAATDGHAKNFSVAHLRGGAYRATPVYDVVSAWPIIGEAPDKLSWHRAKLAMAVRGANPHYRLRDIQRRHWNGLAQRAGVGPDAEAIIEELLAVTPAVIEQTASSLPAGYPEAVAQAIFGGLRSQAETLARMPASM